MFYLSKVRIKNIRCFSDITIDFGGRSAAPGWTAFTGDNASGKSTLLRCLAIGLCDEASAAGLMKESDEGYIRRGETKAEILIELRRLKDSSRPYRIHTTITRNKGRKNIFNDIVRQTCTPSRNIFPWDEIFVSAYGAGRGVLGTGDTTGYSSIDAVYNMFNYVEGLQNPELTIRRIAGGRSHASKYFFNALKKIYGC